MVVVQVTIKRSSKRINTMQRYNTLLFLQTFYTILFTRITIFTINTPFCAISHLFTPPSSHLSHHFRSPTKPPRLLLPFLRHAKPPRGRKRENGDITLQIYVNNIAHAYILRGARHCSLHRPRVPRNSNALQSLTLYVRGIYYHCHIITFSTLRIAPSTSG